LSLLRVLACSTERIFHLVLRRYRIMKPLIALAMTALLLASMSPADAKGCIKGAIAGGVAGHYAGHGVVGAAAGS
jgi:hypothetical protein